MILNDELKGLKELAARFAAGRIATRSDLHQSMDFPPELREAMSRENLFGIGIPVAYQGMGGGWLHMAVAGQALVENGYSLGVALSWLMHVLVSRFVFFGFGTDQQKMSHLPALAKGACTPCLAVSEPGVGGHPKHLATTARKTGHGYRITGEKAYLTNGPIADVYVVLAVTGKDGDRKSYSAFIVPSDTPGLRKTGPMDLGFLRPCPHGGIVLDECEVPRENILGREGLAYQEIAMAFRLIEDVMMMAPFVGGARALISLAAASLKEEGIRPSSEVASLLGETISSVDSLEILAYEAANALDQYHINHPGLASVSLFMRRTAGLVHQRIEEVVQKTGIRMSEPFLPLSRDIASALRIAANVAGIRQKKLGMSLLC
ncbi:MAG TPA: acyl-CoA dehydrogenase family protein [Deltaproteobacteria bacterium]|jgi:acyl-CoA dehydrogenase|nr:acyl-CoA dehydrogenase family protein [Deltaproteobacteria bacterium]